MSTKRTKSDAELKQIAIQLLPIEILFFKHGKGWMLDRLSELTQADYKRLVEIVEKAMVQVEKEG